MGDEINRQQRIYDGINPNRKYEVEKNREAQISRFINDMFLQDTLLFYVMIRNNTLNEK